MNEESRPPAAPRRSTTTGIESIRRAPGRRWWEHPEELPDDELMLVVRSMVAVDRAVDGFRRVA
jgi:hypothetical protein